MTDSLLKEVFIRLLCSLAPLIGELCFEPKLGMKIVVVSVARMTTVSRHAPLGFCRNSIAEVLIGGRIQGNDLGDLSRLKVESRSVCCLHQGARLWLSDARSNHVDLEGLCFGD